MATAVPRQDGDDTEVIDPKDMTAEQRAAYRAKLEEMRREVLAEVESLPDTPDAEGPLPLSNEPLCAEVPLVGARDRLTDHRGACGLSRST